ncbi:MAG: hypothetical protein IJF83_14905 [Methanobrevibacter sp.]|nr:hypothetical protein [Methanobrevibacter sp.]MBQ3353149.1 hypothetical protein [Candidatus Saccharibacteria bacterium]
MKEKRVKAYENKTPLFSGPEILEESIDKKSLECQKTEVTRLKKYIKQKMDQKKPSVVAYLAPYGSGKSVVLKNAIKGLPNSYKVVEYDIWQCSDEKDIWENFLIQFLSKVENKAPNKIIDEIDGTKIKMEKSSTVRAFLHHYQRCRLVYFWQSAKLAHGFRKIIFNLCRPSLLGFSWY